MAPRPYTDQASSQAKFREDTVLHWPGMNRRQPCCASWTRWLLLLLDLAFQLGAGQNNS